MSSERVEEQAAETVFSAPVVDAVSRHMNVDHAADSLLIVRALGGCPAASAATMIGMSPAGIRFEARIPQGTTEIEVPWSTPISRRAEVRAEVVRMYREACAALGVEPRAADDGVPPSGLTEPSTRRTEHVEP